MRFDDFVLPVRQDGNTVFLEAEWGRHGNAEENLTIWAQRVAGRYVYHPGRRRNARRLRKKWELLTRALIEDVKSDTEGRIGKPYKVSPRLAHEYGFSTSWAQRMMQAARREAA